MAPRGGDEPLKRSSSKFNPKRNQYPHTARDHRERVIEEQVRGEPRSLPKGEPLPQQPEEDQEEVNSPEYSYATPAASGEGEYLGPSITSSPQRLFPPQYQSTPHRYFDSSLGQPPQFRYQTFQNVPQPLSRGYTTPPGWPAQAGNFQQGMPEMGGAAGSQLQGQYNSSNNWTSNYGPASHSSYPSAPLVNHGSVRKPFAQAGDRTGTAWDNNPDPQQQGAVQGQSPAQCYLIQNAAQSAPSSLSYNIAQATRNMYPTQVPPSVQPSRSSYFPGATHHRPHPALVSHGSGGYHSTSDDSARELAEGMERATLTTNPSKGSTAVYEREKRSKSRRRNSEVKTGLDSSSSESKPKRSDFDDNDLNYGIRQEESDILSTGGSVYSHINRPRPYDQNNVNDVTREKGGSRSKSRSGRRRSTAYPLSETPHPSGRRRQSDATVIDEGTSGAGFERSITYNQGSVADFRRDNPKSTPLKRSNSEGTAVLGPEEGPYLHNPPLRHHDSNRNNPHPLVQNQKGSQASEYQSVPASLQPELQHQITAPAQLNPEYSHHPSKSFHIGRVFRCLWSEPSGAIPASSVPTEEEMIIAPADYGERAYHSIRRFIIVKQRDGFSLCVPILTYRGQGTNKSGVKPNEHAVIYIGRQPPELLAGEAIYKRAVRVDPLNSREKLLPASRVNYGKVYTVEHNLRVCFIGKIHKDSETTFFTDFELSLSK